VAGFGFGLMSVPLMSLVIDIHSAVIVSSIVAVFANGVQTYLFRSHRDRPLARRLSLASITGLPVGYVIFELVSDRSLRIALGVGVVVAVAMLSRGLNLAHLGPRIDWSLGFVSGVLNTSISTSGPPLVFDLQARRLAPEAFRATINCVFLVSGCVGLAIFAIGGKIQFDELRAGAAAAPSLALGLAVGLPLRRRFSPERFRTLVMVLLVAGAVAAVLKAFV
ncbi:MAG: sulfite exporter TauE/SafE family protein, partial [Ilumatobacteraceae bacterium]